MSARHERRVQDAYRREAMLALWPDDPAIIAKRRQALTMAIQEGRDAWLENEQERPKVSIEWRPRARQASVVIPPALQPRRDDGKPRRPLYAHLAPHDLGRLYREIWRAVVAAGHDARGKAKRAKAHKYAATPGAYRGGLEHARHNLMVALARLDAAETDVERLTAKVVEFERQEERRAAAARAQFEQTAPRWLVEAEAAERGEG